MTGCLIKKNNYQENSMLIVTTSLVVSFFYFYVPAPRVLIVLLPHTVFVFKLLLSMKEVELYSNYLLIKKPFTRRIRKVSSKSVFISDVYNGAYGVQKSYGIVVNHKKNTKAIMRFPTNSSMEEINLKSKLLNLGYGSNNNFM